MRGTYVRGWKFDWRQAREDTDRFRAAGRDWMAASCADPGCVSCPTCGEMHWREYEVFLCCRCGAEVVISSEEYTKEFPNGQTFTGRREVVSSGPPDKPEMVRPKLVDGMRVRYLGTRCRGIDGVYYQMSGRWAAGTIKPGECGTVRNRPRRYFAGESWEVDFDGRTPKVGEDGEPYVWGIFGPFLGDEFEVRTE